MISFKSLTHRKDTAVDEEAQKEQARKESIFGKALNTSRVVKSKKDKYIETKNKRVAYAKLGISFVALSAYSIFFFYGNVVDYLKAPAQIAELQTQNEEYQEVILPELKKRRDLHKAAYDEEYAEVIQALEKVFPRGMDKLGMIQLYESFATEVAIQYPPFEFTSIDLGRPQEAEGYQAIPVSTSIRSSLAGFDKFLSLVDRSGYIFSGEGEDRQVLDTLIRLMSISNISIRYEGVDEETGEEQGVEFSVKLNVYSRPTGADESA